MRQRTKRLRTLARTIERIPVRADIAQAAYEHFQASGELPDDDRVTRSVTSHCRNGISDSAWQSMDFGGQLRRVMARGSAPTDEVMNALYAEAVSNNPLVRGAARDVLVILSDMGIDVTQPVFAGTAIQDELPDHSGVGLWMLGMPDLLVQPPYEEQARRLFARLADLRDRVPQGNRRWFDGLASAVGRFRAMGELPDDGLVRECVLADGEMLCLLRHAQGIDVAEMMAAFDLAASASEAEREHAIEVVVDLADQGVLAAADG